MNDNERLAVMDLLKTVRIGLIIMAVIGGYASKDLLLGLI
jgi:muramoyltetrapeptide carboxypeptidase LdcA involved in peptidoglycan recycling